MDAILKARVEELYAELPEVACRCCGLCCVSPTCTLPEFIYLMDRAQVSLPEKELREAICAAPEIHPDYEGNVRCPFLNGATCGMHHGRTGACRLFGIPSLKHLDIPDLEQCRNRIDIVSGTADVAFITGWLQKVVDLPSSLHTFGDEPYYVRGFNLQCWLDLYFDDTLDTDLFGDMRRVMTANVDLTRFAATYRQCTGLHEKIDKISILTAAVGSGDRPLLRSLLLSIRDDYPLTGTYFYEEAQTMLQVLDQAK